jgi:RHS repeat-associated protein
MVLNGVDTVIEKNVFQFLQLNESQQKLEYKARFYDPNIGKFIQPDSLVGGNRYAYVGNNPINANDPSGNIGCKPGQRCRTEKAKPIYIISSRDNVESFTLPSGVYIGGDVSIPNIYEDDPSSDNIYQEMDMEKPINKIAYGVGVVDALGRVLSSYAVAENIRYANKYAPANVTATFSFSSDFESVQFEGFSVSNYTRGSVRVGVAGFLIKIKNGTETTVVSEKFPVEQRLGSSILGLEPIPFNYSLDPTIYWSRSSSAQIQIQLQSPELINQDQIVINIPALGWQCYINDSIE